MVKNKLLIVFAIILIILSISARIYLVFNQPLGFDEGTEGYVSKEIMNGKVQYLEIFDHKSPLNRLIIIPFINIFGLSILPFHLLAFIYFIITLIIIFLITKNLFKLKYAIISCAIYSVLFISSSLTMVSPMTLFGLLGMWMYILFLKNNKKKFMFLSGIFIAFSIWFKQPGVMFIIVIITHQIYLCLKKQEKLKTITRNILLNIAGILLISIPLLIYFINMVGFNAFFSSIITFNITFYGTIPRVFVMGKVLFLVLSLFGFLLPLIFFSPKKDSKFRSLFIIYFITMFLFFLVNREIFSHHLMQLVPFVAIFSVYSLKFTDNKEYKKIFSILIIIFLILSILTFYGGFVRNEGINQKEIIIEINRLIPKNTEVFADNSIYLLLGGYTTSYKIFFLAPGVSKPSYLSDFCEYLNKVDYLILTHRKKYLGENIDCVLEDFKMFKRFDNVGESFVELYKR